MKIEEYMRLQEKAAKVIKSIDGEIEIDAAEMNIDGELTVEITGKHNLLGDILLPGYSCGTIFISKAVKEIGGIKVCWLTDGKEEMKVWGLDRPVKRRA